GGKQPNAIGANPATECETRRFRPAVSRMLPPIVGVCSVLLRWSAGSARRGPKAARAAGTPEPSEQTAGTEGPTFAKFLELLLLVVGQDLGQFVVDFLLEVVELHLLGVGQFEFVAKERRQHLTDRRRPAERAGSGGATTRTTRTSEAAARPAAAALHLFG